MHSVKCLTGLWLLLFTHISPWTGSVSVKQVVSLRDEINNSQLHFPAPNLPCLIIPRCVWAVHVMALVSEGRQAGPSLRCAPWCIWLSRRLWTCWRPHWPDKQQLWQASDEAVRGSDGWHEQTPVTLSQWHHAGGRSIFMWRWWWECSVTGVHWYAYKWSLWSLKVWGRTWCIQI